MTLPFVTREFPIDPQGLLPPITPDSDPFWGALALGVTAGIGAIVGKAL